MSNLPELCEGESAQQVRERLGIPIGQKLPPNAYYSATRVIQERSGPHFKKGPLPESLNRIPNLGMSRRDILHVLHSGTVDDETFEKIVDGPFEQLQDILAGLVPNSLPDDDDVLYFWRLRPGNNGLDITCVFKNDPVRSPKATLTLDLHHGWAYRARQISGDREFPNNTAPPLHGPWDQ